MRLYVNFSVLDSRGKKFLVLSLLNDIVYMPSLKCFNGINKVELVMLIFPNYRRALVSHVLCTNIAEITLLL